MEATRDNITIPLNQWVDVYSLAGIDKRSAIDVQNTGTSDLFYSISQAQPSLDNTKYRILRRGDSVTLDPDGIGVWFFSYEPEGLINIAKLDTDQGAAQKTAFGEVEAAQLRPVTQISAQYGLLNNVLVVVDKNASGSATAQDSKFVCSTGTAPDGLASVSTLKQVAYRPGQGLMARFTAIFSPGMVNSQQAAGFINAEDILAFGFIDDQFGIIHANGGKLEIQELTITTPASGTETASVVIDATQYNVTLTAGTAQHNAYEIATQLDGVVPNYTITSVDNKVVARSLVSLPQGLFSFSSATAAGQWQQIAAGQIPTVMFTPQDQWNRDGASWLDPTKGNVYWIKMQYLGFGPIRFYINDPDTGNAILVHEIQWANNTTQTSVTNPTFRIGWLARNVGNTTNITVSGASAAGFIEGNIVRDAGIESANNTQLSVGTTKTNILTIRNTLTFGGRANRAEVLPILVSAATDTAKATIFEAIINADFGGDMIFSYHNQGGSIVEMATDKVPVSGGKSVGTVVVRDTSPQVIRFNQTEKFDTVLLPGQTLTISAFITGGAAADMTASITWLEDI